MAEIKTLKAKETDGTEFDVYPRTVLGAITDTNTNDTLDNIIDDMNTRINSATGGGGETRTLLWTNPSYSYYCPTEIEINCNIKDYDFIEILYIPGLSGGLMDSYKIDRFKIFTSTNPFVHQIISCKGDYNAIFNDDGSINSYTSGTLFYYVRNFSINYETSKTIITTSDVNSFKLQVDSSISVMSGGKQCISPIYIYGVNCL